MGTYIVEGGKRLYGQVDIGGSKNAALPVLCATLMNSGKSIIHNCPDISDIYDICEILRDMGCAVEMYGDTIIIDSSKAEFSNVKNSRANKIRSSVTLMGAMAGRFKKFSLPKPGGCTIGKRPIDIHIYVLEKLGAKVYENDNEILVETMALRGSIITLPFPSVGATENAIMAASFAKGKTVICNAAKEPEIVCLQDFINSMGGNVTGAGTGTIIIDEQKKFKDTEFEIIYDRIEAGTFLCYAAACGGEIFLKNAPWQQMISTLKCFDERPWKIYTSDDGLYIKSNKKAFKCQNIVSGVYPQIPTDMQPIITALLTMATGTSIIIETVFENRFQYAKELCKMGADISFFNHVCIVNGVKRLKGAESYICDLRGGAGIILSALCADGRSKIHNSHFVERGYESIERKLRSLGAEIKLTDEM